jgi:DNA repair exonuclease SbcCD nuclease subunit
MGIILTADWHLKYQKPRCRLDENWKETQKKAIEEIKDIANKKDSDLIIVGDIFNSPHQPAEIVNMVIDVLKQVENNVYIFPGNHDLPFHSYENEHKSSYGILKRTFDELTRFDNPNIPLNTILTHELIFPNDKARPIKEIGKTAEELLEEILKEYSEVKWIFVGDYHHSFHFEKNGRHVINPGCIIRQAADFINYQPIVYYVDTEKEVVEALPLSDTGNMVTDEYITAENERENRIQSFIESIKNNSGITLDFIKNLENKLKSNKLEGDCKEILIEIIEEVS